MPKRSELPLLLDSSVLVKWFVEEPDSAKALSLRQGLKARKLPLATTELALYETANALRYGGLFTTNELHAQLDILISSGITILDFDLSVLHVAIEISQECNVSVYDAYFVAQADLEALTLITADTTLAKKMHGVSDVTTLTQYTREPRDERREE